MLLFAFLYSLAEIVFFVVVVIQFFTQVFGQKPNEQLLSLGLAISRYINQILLYLSFNSQHQPYPMNPWPQADGVSDQATTPQAPPAQPVEQPHHNPEKQD